MSVEPGAVERGRQGELVQLVQGVHEPAPVGERRLRLNPSGLQPAAALLAGEGARFVSLFLAERPRRALVAAFAYRGELAALAAPLGGQSRAYPALSAVLPACQWDERALHDLEGLEPIGHPDLRPIARPDPDHLERRIGGEETFLIPYGPIRSGVFEAIQFVITTGGEDVLALDLRPFFKQRGLEQRFRGLGFDHGVALAERVAGVAGVAHALAFTHALERALGVEAPPRAALWRTVHAELERIANHLDVAARLAEDAALAVGQARFQILKEEVMRLRAQMTGSRFGRGMILAGGVRDEGGLSLDQLADAVRRFERDLLRDRSLLVRTSSFTDRLIGSGRLDRRTVERLAGVGPVARAAGVSADARFERPYAGYRHLGFEVVTRDGGDAMARLEVRFGEIAQSLHLLRQAVDRLRRRRGGELRASLPDRAEGAAFGWSEAPQGELVYWLEACDGRTERVRIASPSFRNWPLFAESFRGDVLTDFAFIEHSFGLTPAGADR